MPSIPSSFATSRDRVLRKRLHLCRRNQHNAFHALSPTPQYTAHTRFRTYTTQYNCTELHDSDPAATMLLYHSLAAALPLLSLSAAQTWPSDIVGTWTTKSNKTITGPVCLARQRLSRCYANHRILAVILRPPQRRIHRARTNRDLLFLHRRRTLRRGILPRNRKSARPIMSFRNHAVAARKLGHECEQ